MQHYKRCVIFLIPFFLFPLLYNNQQEINKPELKEVIDEICQLLRDNYVFPEVAEKICDTLQLRMKAGAYNVESYDKLSDLLTVDLQSVNNDQHLKAWSLRPSSAQKSADEKDLISLHLNIILQNKRQNFNFTRVEILEGNVGYIELVKFKPVPDPTTERILNGAMDFLSNCDALIIDLRRNNGGNSKMLEMFSSYFFNEPVQLTGHFYRESGSVQESWTLKDFDNKNFADIPLFIIVGSETISAPEQFAYDMQVLKRATIVGEKTAGAANPGRFFRIKERILLLVATGYAVNPITKTNWEGKGITPDVAVSAEKALDKALELAQKSAKELRNEKQKKVDDLIALLKEQMKDVEITAKTDLVQAEKMLDKSLNHFFAIEYMTKYLLLDWIDDYLKKNNVPMGMLICKQGIKHLLGDIYLNMGENLHALKCYGKILELSPNDRKILKKVKLITEKIELS
jgi:tetratricopeptide (TPR) repeat protein